jgi:hypothetical protein
MLLVITDACYFNSSIFVTKASEQRSPGPSSTLQTRLSHLFDINPDSYVNEHGTPFSLLLPIHSADIVLKGTIAVPARAMLSILRAFSEEHGVTLIKDEEGFVATTNAMPDFEITPSIMIDLILQLTGTLPPSPSASSTSSTTTSPPLSMQRALSEGSGGFSEAAPGVSQAQPNVFEARQRTGPLEPGIPSTWKNRPHRARGRSETGFAAITGTASDVRYLHLFVHEFTCLQILINLNLSSKMGLFSLHR